ncbi:hypothetical protein [Streptomyces sp. NPDC001816]|uniref:hypothetical protein n=1 Tax=Streptomyces sp. NPDC001816 TaxID=3364612 RepID=UPI003685E8F9
MTRAVRHDHGKPYADEDLGEVDGALFTQQPAPEGRGVIVAGTCPRCHGPTRTLFPWARPGTGSKGVLTLLFGSGQTPRAEGEPGPLLTEVHLCECGHAHPQCPPDTSYVGCGASWRIRR